MPPPKKYFWALRLAVLDQNGPKWPTWNTPKKRALFLGRGRKRMKDWGEVTFMKEWMKAQLVAVLSLLMSSEGSTNENAPPL